MQICRIRKKSSRAPLVETDTKCR